MKRCAAVIIFINLVTHTGFAQDTVHVYTGWNNIGSLGSGMTPAELVTVPPGIMTTSMYEYNPGTGYLSSDTLARGRGYWVKVNSDGIVIFNAPPPADTCDIQQVNYGGITYHTVRIGNRCWLKENLNIGKMIPGVNVASNNDTIEKYCYNNDTANCTAYGGLYQWDEAMQYATTPGAQGICPSGWHLPTLTEFETLSTVVGGDGNALKAVGEGTGGGAGTNTSGFSALLAGGRHHTGVFYGLAASASLCSSGENNELSATSLNLLGSDNSITITGYFKVFGISVRCVGD